MNIEDTKQTKLMKVEMKILTKTYNDDEFNKVVEGLEKQGWKLKNQYGGKMPNYTGHGAVFEKFCLAESK